MRFDILTIFPEFFASPLEEGILRRARQAGRVVIEPVDIRAFATDRHRTTDDRPFGGGEGMVMKPEPLAAAIRHARSHSSRPRVIYLGPHGRRFTQQVAEELSRESHLVLVCGRYEGIDERIRAHFVDEELSIGDFILTGGELAALVVVDATVRLLPGVLGSAESASCETFTSGLLKHPQYTRPRVFEGMAVPEVLLSGDHQAVARWRFIQAVRRTLALRPDLLRGRLFSRSERKWLTAEGLWPAAVAATRENHDTTTRTAPRQDQGSRQREPKEDEP